MAPNENPKKPRIMELLKSFEQGLLPDEELRKLIRAELERRLRWGYKPTYEEQLAETLEFVRALKQMDMATEMDPEDSQMYEVPISFLNIIFGPTVKESCCYFRDESTTLAEAETAMLDLYCERAKIKDGQRVLDLGCGQGSLTLHIAQRYKNCMVTGVTNLKTHKDLIDARCKKLGLSNVDIMLADVTTLEMNATFDRLMVVGFIEHMKNYDLLLKKISPWMAEDGLLFVEHICHKTLAYYGPLDEDDWYTEYFFPAGSLVIPSASVLLYFQDNVSAVDHWIVNGKHFARTNEEWLKRMDANLEVVKEIMESFAGSREVGIKWTNQWRGLCMHAMESFGYNNGEEWMISQVLLKKK